MLHQEQPVCAAHPITLGIHRHPGRVSALSTVSHQRVGILFFESNSATHMHRHTLTMYNALV